MADSFFRLDLDIGGQRYANAELGLAVLAAKSEQAILEMTPIARREMVDILDTVVDAMRQRHSTRWRRGQRLPTGDRTGKLAKRSGRGVNNLKGEVKTVGDDVTGSIYVPFPLSVHEDGALIRKKGKMLAIPLPDALDSRGRPLKRGPRAWRNTFVARSRKGNLLIFQKRGRGEIVPLYVLKDQVKIPRRLGMGVTMEKAAPIYIERVFHRALENLKKAGI